MSTTHNGEELTLNELDQVSGGQDGGNRRELEGVLYDDELAKISGGQDGGLSRELEGEIDLNRLDNKES